jgi:hypothetical protein
MTKIAKRICTAIGRRQAMGPPTNDMPKSNQVCNNDSYGCEKNLGGDEATSSLALAHLYNTFRLVSAILGV